MTESKKTKKKRKPKSKLPKEFEQQIFKAFNEIPGVSIDRIPDQVTKYKGSSQNICDYLVYYKPTLYYIECKTVHGNTLPFSNIRDNQWVGLSDKSKIPGVQAGVICWWVDHDVTLYLPIQVLLQVASAGGKSVRYDIYSPLVPNDNGIISIPGKKKRVYFDYDVSEFLEFTRD